MRELTGIAVVFLALALPIAARADDPHDPTMRTAAARARDHAMIRSLNQRELAAVRRRDAAEAQRQADYAKARERYERDMAAWRQATGQDSGD